MTIRHPNSEQIPQLKALWQLVFGDPDAFLDRFFSLAYSRERCLCAQEGDSILGMLYWLPCGQYAYLYAVATHPAHRGKGICRALMEQAHRAIACQGFEGVLLYPQEEGLRSMYRKMGYCRETTLRQFRCEAGPSPIALEEISAGEYFDLRKAMLPPRSVPQESPFRELSEGLSFYRGEGLLLAAEARGQSLAAAELLGDPGSAPGILRFLGKDRGTFRCPGSGSAFAMFRPLRQNAAVPCYFAFPLE